MTTDSWITLAGAIGSISAALVAMFALLRVSDERRRTFRMTLLDAMIDAVSEVPDVMFSEKAMSRLHVLPGDWLPTLRVRLGVRANQAMHDKYAADMKADGVDRFPDHWVRERTHEEIAAKLNELP